MDKVSHRDIEKTKHMILSKNVTYINEEQYYSLKNLWRIEKAIAAHIKMVKIFKNHDLNRKIKINPFWRFCMEWTFGL